MKSFSLYICHLQTNNITNVPSGILPPDLIEIFFLKNPIVSIDDDAFDASADTLEALSFSEARFTKISNAFSHLKSFKYLSIYDTNILDYNEDVLIHIGPTLLSLVLENVGLLTWPVWMKYFSNLTELSLSDGMISSLPDNALDKLTNSLVSLSLFKNNLTTIPKTVSKLSALTMLDLHQNRIVDATWLPLSSKLSSLSLNNNNLTGANSLSDSLIHFADSLKDVDVHGNQLTSIPNFGLLTGVESLDFSANLISDSDSGSVPPTLLSLDLGHNSLPSVPRIMLSLHYVFEMFLQWNGIKQIRATDFSKSTTGVYLDYNLVEELTDDSFPPNSNIATLQLSNNPLSKISDSAFTNLPRLMELNLCNTKLTRLPVALASLSSLNLIDFTNSSSLVCTCAEKSLETWITTRPPESILGDCGETSIVNFYLHFSSACPMN